MFITITMGIAEVLVEVSMLATITDLHIIDITMLMTEDKETSNRW